MRRRLPSFPREPGPVALIAIVVLVIACGAWALVDVGRAKGPAEPVTGNGAPTAAYVPTAPLEVPPSGAATSGAPPSQAGTPSPGTDGVIGSPARAPTTTKAAGPVPTTAARSRPTATRPTPTEPGTTPATATLAGTYSLDVVWTGRFQASVVLHNDTASQQSWTILLTYGSGITANAAAWVDGAPSPKVGRTGNSWTFTAGAPLAAGNGQTLRVQFDISDQKAPTSVSCTVNGRACVMS
ncbi:hypothetical protein GCM10009682_01040 [Luedemannella flava]|uniref:CBM2 domain-containing protein n=1 Tax=Luedemannella flava TaxID=349316 RepID=A0ABN2LBE3_9ACTN